MLSPNPFNFDRPKRRLPGPIWAKILGGLGLIFFVLGIIFAPIGGMMWLRGTAPEGIQRPDSEIGITACRGGPGAVAAIHLFQRLEGE